MDGSVERVGGGAPGPIERLREKAATVGVGGAMTAALNKLLRRGASLDLVHVLLLAADDLVADPPDALVETRFLTSDEVRAHAAYPENDLSRELAARIDRGLDFCCAALCEGRLAGYSWLAVRSVEPEHAAGVALRLPQHMAYLYKAFTLPEFRGRRVYSAITAEAVRRLGSMGITHLVAFVYWNNAAALRACRRMGYRRLGLLAARGNRLLHAPAAARYRGILFGPEAVGVGTGAIRR